MATCLSLAVDAQQPGESMSLQLGETDATSDSLRDLFEQGEYFQGEGEDSLSQLLKKARELDASDGRSQNDSAAMDELEDPRESSRRSASPKTDNELRDDEPTESLDDPVESQEDEERSQAEEEMKQRDARQRALAQHLLRLQKPLHQVRVAGANSQIRQAPVNRAAAAISHQRQRLVTSSNANVKRANRYPTQFTHRPLYFEEPNLERCGRGYGCLQNVVSSGHFLFNTFILPYRLATQPANCSVATRGDCRTGESFSSNIEPLVDGGKNDRGLLVEAASLAGFTFLLL